MGLDAPEVREVTMADDKDTQRPSRSLRNHSPVELSSAHDIPPGRCERESLTNPSDVAAAPSVPWNGGATRA